MEKHWKSKANQVHELCIGEEVMVGLDFSNKKNIKVQSNGQEYKIKRKRRWSRTLKVLDENQSLVAETFRKKWYSEKLTFRYQEKEFIIQSRNNPLFEVVLQDLEKQDILAYGIKVADLKENLLITESQSPFAPQDYLADVILYVLFISTPRMDILEDLL